MRSKLNKYEHVWEGIPVQGEGDWGWGSLYKSQWGQGQGASLAVRSPWGPIRHRSHLPPWTKWQTGTTENITFPQLCWTTVNISLSVVILDPFFPKVVAVAARKLEASKSFAQKFDIPRSYGSYEELARDENVGKQYIVHVGVFRKCSFTPSEKRSETGNFLWYLSFILWSFKLFRFHRSQLRWRAITLVT